MVFSTALLTALKNFMARDFPQIKETFSELRNFYEGCTRYRERHFSYPSSDKPTTQKMSDPLKFL